MPSTPLTAENLPLHDIHLPPPVSWWPPAPGWWLLLVTIVIFLAAIYFLHNGWYRRRYKRLALKQLQELEQQYQLQDDCRQLYQALSRLLRQAALLHFPKESCAGLVGETWLTFLDQKLGDKSFSDGIGRQIISGPYTTACDKSDNLNATELILLCRRWLHRLPPAPHAKRRRQ